MRNVCWMVVAGGVLAVSSAGVLARPAPPTRPAGRVTTQPAPNPIPNIVKALLAEFAEAQQANRTYTRQRPDFLVTHPEKPTQEQLWRALEGRHSPDPRADAYVKWQLLSGLTPGEADEASVRRIAGLVARAPAPAMHPLLEARNRSMFEAMASRLRPGSEDQANDRLRELSEDALKYNLPVFNYREELLSRLPPSAGRFVLTFEDMAERARLGWQVDRYRDRTLTEVRNWADTASPAEIQTLLQTIQRLRTVQSEEMHSRLRPDGMALRWDRRRARVESWDNTVLSLQNELSQRARTGAGR